MKTLLMLSAIALATPAFAQTTGAPASTNAAQPATPATGATPAQPATDAPTAQGATSAQPATPATPAAPSAEAAPANSADAVATVVSTDWSKYDADTNDGLSKDEFGKWMTALREQNPAQKAAVKDVAGWTTAAFTQADKDKSGAVSKTELQGFLKG